MIYSIFWNVDADGDWKTAADWSPVRLPGASDDVSIDTADFHTITYSSGATTVDSLNVGNDAFSLTGGTLTLTSTSQFANALSIGSATLRLNGATSVLGLFSETDGSTITGKGDLVLAGGGTIAGNMTGKGTTQLEGATSVHDIAFSGGRVLENLGTLTVVPKPEFLDAVFTLGTSSSDHTTFKNDVGGTIDFTSSTIIQGSSGRGVSTHASFINAGHIVNDASSQTEIAVSFANKGTISLDTGSLSFEAGGTSTVSGISMASGTILTFQYDNLDPFTFTGSGTLGVTGSTLNLNGGLLNFTSAAVIDSFLEAQGGVIGGPGTLTLAGGAWFEYPTTLMGPGKTILQGSADVPYELAVNGHVLENQNVLTVDGNSNFSNSSIDLQSTSDGAAILKNDSDGTIVFQAFDVISSVSGDNSSELINAGTVKNIDNNVTSDIEVGTFINTGAVLDQYGQMTVTGHMTGSGTVEVDSGARFIFDGSSTSLENHVNIASGTGIVDLTGGTAADIFAFAGNFSAADAVDGGAGNDTMTLNGDYSAGLTFAATTMTNMEKVAVAAGHSYDLTFNDASVAAGQTLTVDGSALGASDVLTVDGSAETNGRFILKGGAGNDLLIGGKGSDTIMGGLGGDHITPGAGADTLLYTAVAQSTGPNFDTLTGIDFAADRFDLNVAVTGIDTEVKGGTLSLASFNTDLSTAIGTHLLAGHAVLFAPNAGDEAGKLFLIVDVSGSAGYQANHDYVFQLDSSTHLSSLSTADFV